MIGFFIVISLGVGGVCFFFCFFFLGGGGGFRVLAIIDSFTFCL